MVDGTQLAPLLLGAVVSMIGLAALAVSVACGPVSRARLARFAKRHNVVITANNGNHVIRYLATTRRWRVGGAWFGVLALLVMSMGQGHVQVNLPAAAAGWFGGALIAEARLAPARSGSRRAASLTPRLPEAYLSRLIWWLLPAAAGVSVGVAVLMVVVTAPGNEVSKPAAVLWSTLAVVFAVIVDAVRRRVLRRGQPLAAPDILAADDAIRSRSLHVLTGGGFMLVSFCVLGQLAALRPGLGGTGSSIVDTFEPLVGLASTACAILVAVLGGRVRQAPPTRGEGGPA